MKVLSLWILAMVGFAPLGIAQDLRCIATTNHPQWITGENVRLRSSPSLGGGVTHLLALGTPLEVLRQSEQRDSAAGVWDYWYEVKISTEDHLGGEASALVGWVFGAFVSPSPKDVNEIDPCSNFFDKDTWYATKPLPLARSKLWEFVRTNEWATSEDVNGIRLKKKTIVEYEGEGESVYQIAMVRQVGKDVLELQTSAEFHLEFGCLTSFKPAPCPASEHPCKPSFRLWTATLSKDRKRMTISYLMMGQKNEVTLLRK